MRVLLALTLLATVDAVFQPTTNAQLKTAVDACIAENSAGNCPTFAGTTVNVGEGSGTYGLIGTWDVSQVTDMTEMFYNKNYFNQDLNGWDVSSVVDMTGMFRAAAAFNQDLSAWDVSQVTDMEFMFFQAIAFNGDVSTWDVSQVTDMYATFFYNYAFNQDISKWDVSSVTTMREMFFKASIFNQDLSAWDVSSVTTMKAMFDDATAFNQDLSAWDVSSVTNMNSMFKDASAFNQVLCGQAWVDSTATQTSMFTSSSGSIAGSACDCPYNLCREETHPTGGSCSAGTCTCTAPFGGDRCGDCQAGTQRVGATCVECPDGEMSAYDSTCGASCAGSLTQVGKKCVFQLANKAALQSAVDTCINENSAGNCPSYEPIGLWDVSQVTDMLRMFYNKHQFNQDLSAWDVGQVTSMGKMFYSASAFNQDLSKWNVGRVTTMYEMFYSASAFNQDLSAWDVGQVTDMNQMFQQASSFGYDLSAWDVGRVTFMNYMFKQASAFNHVLCGDAWLNSGASKIQMFTSSSGSIAGSACACPYNLCLNQTHNTGGSCSAGTCTCPAPFGGDRCQYVVCPPGEQPVGDVCVACPDGQMSAYASTCGASCAGSLTQVGKKCVFQPADKAALQTAVDACIAEDSSGACPSYDPIRYWDVSQVTDMEDLFYNKYDFNQPLNDWNVSQVTDMSRMFFYCAYFNQPLPDWDTSKVTDMYYMFGKAWRFNEDVDNWNVANVEYMHGMFYGGGSDGARKPAGGAEFNRDISLWNVNKVLNIGYMFQQQPNMQKDLSSWNVRSDVNVDPGTFDLYTTELCGIAWSEVVDNDVNSKRCATPPDEATCVAGGLNFCPRDGVTGEGGTCKGCEGCVDKPNITWTGTCRPAPDGRCDIRKVGDGSCNTNKNYIKCGQQSEADCESFGNECCIWVDTADSIAKEPGVCVWKVGFNNQLDGVCAQTQAHAQYSLETILIGQSGLFADLPNGPASSKLLSQCTGGNTVCLGEYGCEHTTSGVLGGGYGDAEGDCMVWENEENCQGSYFCPNYGCVSTCEDCCDYPINGSRITCAATCQEGYSVQDGECTECATGFTRAAGDDPTAGNTVCWKYLANVNGKDFYEFDGSNKGSQNMCADIDSGFVSPTLYSECLSAKALNTGLSEDYHNPMTVPDTSKSGTAANWMNKKPYPCVVQDENFVINLEGATSCTECTGLAHHSINPICVKTSMDRTGLFQALQDCVGCCQRACSAVSPLDTASGIDAGTLGSAECDAANAFCDAADGMHNDWTDGDGASCGALDTSEVRSLHYLFYRAETMNVNISGWDVSKVTNGRSTFFRAASFNQDISSWNTSNFLTMRSMFHKASSFNQPLSAWDVTSVVDMQDMFRDASAFNQDISLWKVTRVTNMQGMFYGATAFNQDLSGWNVAKVTDMTYMFASATALNYDLSAWSVGNVNSLDNVFHNAGYGFTLCGDAWVNLNVSDTDFGATISGPCVDSCPYNYCMNNTHLTGGVCAAGVCTCPIPLEGDRCDLRCPGKRFRIANGCDECVPGYAKTGGTCRNASVSESDFLATFKAGKVKAERAKAVRGMVRPMRDTKKTLKENVVSVPMETADLTDEQVTLIQEMEATFGGTLELKMSVAAEQTAPLENPSAAECTFDIKDQETGKKTVLQAYGVDNYVYICDTTSGTMDFVAEVKETETGSDVRCRNESVWDAAVSKIPGETEICKGVPVLIGSVTLACGPDGGCCTDAECERGDCINSVCVCEPLYEGNRCHIPKLCEDIKEADLYQKKGCCDC